MVGQGRRVMYGVYATTALAALSILYYQALKPIVALATGDHSGEFTTVAESLDALVPVVIVGLLLFVWVWVLVAPVQEERARRVLRR